MQKWMQHQQRLIEAHWSERAALLAQIEDRDREIARLMAERDETDEAWMARVYPDHGYVPSEGMTYAQFCRAARATWEQRVGSEKP